jgi:hypothetical protein
MSYQSLELVCANGHVIMESAYDTTRQESEKVIRDFAREKLNPWCMLCGSRQWSVREKQKTPADLGAIAKRFYGEQAAALLDHRKGVKGN